MPQPSPISALRIISRFSSIPKARIQPTRTFKSIHHPLSVPKPRISPLLSIRFNSSTSSSPPPPTQEQTTSSRPLTDRQPASNSTPTPQSQRPKQPEYELTFTCTPCSTRSTHKITKQGYHYGSVLITCPECRNRHVISDHLNIFGDRSLTIEDLMREQGQIVKKGTLSEDGNIEFWADGSETVRGDGASAGTEAEGQAKAGGVDGKGESTKL